MGKSKGINSWDDHCPECGYKCIAACKCLLNDRKCANGHWWRREYKTDKAIMLDGPHGEPLEAGVKNLRGEIV